MANFPTSLDNSSSLPNPTGTSTQASPDHASLHVSENSAIIAAETKLGIGASTPTSTMLLRGTGVGTSAWDKAAPTGTIVGTTDSQTLTNKVLTSPTINAPTITNATITADTISGFSSASTGTVYGMSVTSGILASAALVNTVNTAALQTNAVTTIKVTDAAITPPKWTNQYKFGVYRANAANTGNAAFALITFDTKSFDTNTNYSTSTGLYTAPVAGYYQFNSVAGITSTTTFALSFFKNGVEYNRYGEIGSSTGTTFLSGSMLVQLAANDTIGVYAFGATAVALNLTGGLNSCSFSGFLVSIT